MSKSNKKPLPLLRGIEITDIAVEGKAIAKVDEMVVFVPFAVPGDVVDLQKLCRSAYCRLRALLRRALLGCVRTLRCMRRV